EKPIITNESFMDWFVMICKRITEKDDKEDGVHSYFNQHNKIRGGQLCLNNLLTLFKKVSLSFIIIFTVFTLSGCAMNLDPIDSQATGIFDHYFIYPFSLLIKMVANWF